MKMIPNCGVVALLLFAITAGAQQPLLQGINHTPIAVSDLEKAEADFRAMGFTIKPGRLHPDGIRNAHVKFADETELELITAPQSVDDLTSEYRSKIEHGDGPVYYGLDSPDPAKLLKKAHAVGLPRKEDDGLLTFPIGHPLHAVFFGRLGATPTDRPEYFVHPNTATRLSGFWVRDSKQLRDLFSILNVSQADLPACGPVSNRATIARLPEGDVYLVTSANTQNLLAARVDVQSIATAETILHNAGFKPQQYNCDKASLWLPPSVAHGIWIQFTQPHH